MGKNKAVMKRYPKVGTLTVGGVDYPAVINGRVLMDLEKVGLGLEDIMEGSQRRWAAMFTITALAIQAGSRILGEDSDANVDEIAELIGITDLNDLATQISRLVTADRTVEAEPPKN